MTPEIDLEVDVVDFLPAGVAVDLTTCDREPIHLSGAIQPHGVLVAVDEVSFKIGQVSTNLFAHFAVDPAVASGEPLQLIIGSEPVERLRAALVNPRSSGLEPMPVHLSNGKQYDLAWHRTRGLIIIELEPAEAPDDVAMASVVADVDHALKELQTAATVAALCQVAATEIKHLTGYDRVMTYRFHPDGHGEVVAEARQPDSVPFLGLHYPASDIPAQARKLYLLNHLRMIVDVDYAPVPLTGETLDLSLVGLRSVSPFHLEYLHNMGVGATLTVSLMLGNRLWGMLACHHDSPKRLDAHRRAACRVLGRCFALQLVSLERREQEAHRARLAEIQGTLVERMAVAESLAGALIPSKSHPQVSVLDLTGADGMVAHIDGQRVSLGAVPGSEAVDAILARLRAEDVAGFLVCSDLPERFPEIQPFAEQACGLLATALTAGYHDYILWFRGERIQEFMWGGDPNKTFVVTDTAASADEMTRLSPRASFASWAQEVRGHSRPWEPAEVETANALAAEMPELLLARDRDRLAHLALHDTLTGLANRALLLDRSDHALARQKRGAGTVVMLFIDLDSFKAVNDVLGHSSGDRLLCQAAGRLTAAVRETDTVARIGGDEFVILCESLERRPAKALAERIVRAFQKPFMLDAQRASVTCSVGMAFALPAGVTTSNDLLRDADAAMYNVKQSGRNAAGAFTDGMKKIIDRRLRIENGIGPALHNRELCLHFQPIHDTNARLTGFEALARWPVTGHGMVPPTEFIPIAEKLGLIDMLTEWVLDEGLGALAGWRRHLPDSNLTLAVNITASQMAGSSLSRVVKKSLERHNLPSNALCLEITESAFVTDTFLTHSFLGELHDHGVRLSIDDFGTGYSSLSYLTRLTVDELKIDQTFIAGLPSSPDDVTIVGAVIGLAHQLGLKAVAEGVETEGQMKLLRELDCDPVQGYLLGHPMAASEMGSFIDRAKVMT